MYNLVKKLRITVIPENKCQTVVGVILVMKYGIDDGMIHKKLN
jgi:hypothetical protein